MSTKLSRAVEEAGAFLGAHESYRDDREVRLVAPAVDEDCPLSLGTVRALYELAKDVAEITAEYGPELSRR
jgi:hypothetical protein